MEMNQGNTIDANRNTGFRPWPWIIGAIVATCFLWIAWAYFAG